MPWVLAKSEDKTRLEEVMYNLAESIRRLGICLYPFMPETSDRILKGLGITPDHTFDSVKEKFGCVKEYSVSEAEVMFQRIDAEKLLNELSAKKEEPKAESTPQCTTFEIHSRYGRRNTPDTFGNCKIL